MYLIMRVYGALQAIEVVEEKQHRYIVKHTWKKHVFKNDSELITTMPDRMSAYAAINRAEPFEQAFRDEQNAAGEAMRIRCHAARDVRDAAVRDLFMRENTNEQP